MRRETIILFLAGFAGAGPAAAQGLGWLFGEPPAQRRAPRVSRPPPVAAVPLPVPRPHFPGDDAPAADIARAPETLAPPAIEHTLPGDGAATPPLPPERPPQADLQPPPQPVVTPQAKRQEDTAGKEAVAPATAPVQPAPPAQPGASTPTTPTASGPVPTPPVPPEKPADLAVRPAAPTVAPSGATTAFNPREPAADAGCEDRLKSRGVVAEVTALPPQPDARCTVAQPMRLVSARLEDGATVLFPDKPTIACITVDAFSAYVHDLLAPLARGTWGVGLASVWTGPGLECRSRDHVFGAKLSAHGQGLAVDIAQLKLGDGRIIAVGEPKTDAEQHFEMAARAGGCGYFHTVLGPGSDSYHRTHWHFDLEVRGRDGDGKYCK